MTMILIEGRFWINEQDPYEPRGVMFRNSDGKADLADLLIKRFDVKIGKPTKKYLKVTIEEMD